MSNRVVPLSGTDASRVAVLTAFPDKLQAGEVHSTSDQNRLFLNNKIVASLWLGSASDEAAMLAKNTSFTYGCFPGDFVNRIDTGTVWICVSNRGEDLSDWFEFPRGAVSFAAGDVTYDHTTSGLSATDVQAALDELAAAVASVPPPPDAIDVPYNHSSSGLSANNVQDAIDEVAAGGGGGGSVFDLRDVWLLN